MRNLLLLLIIFFASNANAFFFHYKKGFKITPHHPPADKVALKSGETTTLTGELCVVQWGLLFHKEKCRPIIDKKIHFKAYFPDATTDVSDLLTIEKSKNKKQFTYSFTTPELSTGSRNTFTLVIGKTHTKVDKLLKAQAKLEKRIIYLEERINKYKEKVHKEKHIAWLEKYKAKLIHITGNITRLIEENPDVIAKMQIPLQVDNEIAAPFYYSTMMSGHKMSLEIPLGSPIAGESTEVRSSVVNLSHLSFWFPQIDGDTDDDNEAEDDGLHKYRSKLSFNGQEVFDSGLVSNPFGSAIEHSFPVGPLNPHDLNNIDFVLSKQQKSKFFKGKHFERKWGVMDYQIPVAEDLVPPTWARIYPEESTQFVQYFPAISADISDSFGRIDKSSISLVIDQTLNDGSQSVLDKTASLNLENLDSGRSYRVSGSYSDLAEGAYAIKLEGADYAENQALPDPVIRSFRVDRTKPVINLLTEDNVLTNNPLFDISVDVFDHSPVQIRVVQNGNEVYSTSDYTFVYQSTLVEGFNTFEIHAVDAAGNVGELKKLSSIELDTIPPELSNIIPTNGDILSVLDFTQTGESNEPLSIAKVNGIIAVLNGNKNKFSAELSAPAEGFYEVNVEVADLAGNITSKSYEVQIILKVLNADLISLEPSTSNSAKLLVKGTRGASRPGVEIKFDAGFFNTKYLNSNPDGSFEIELDTFNQIVLSAYDQQIDRGDTITLQYNVDTTLSGNVRDNNDQPLPGATVRIVGTDLQVITDGTGSFKIPNPATGDQIIQIDGTTIPENISGPTRQFSVTNIAVSIGSTQLNVLERPIYLAPKIVDGTETTIPDEDTAVTVSSPHAPGVELTIPAGVATFPGAKKDGVISIIEIQSDRAAIPPLEFAEPETVYAFEPSGLTFSEPVELTLPNINEFPPGTEIVILSKNSLTGIWEADGVANVTEDGSSIRTKKGMGITHFSEIYAAPLGPKITELGGNDRPGAEVFNGELKTSIQLPTYKSLGEDVGVGLSYSSAWAAPMAVVTNLFDIPRNRVVMYYPLGGGSGILAKVDATLEVDTWIEPNFIDAWFITEGFTSAKVRFEGVPNKSVISYAIDLKSQPSGVFPYLGKYEIHLKRMVLRTITIREKKRFSGARVSQSGNLQTQKLKEVFPTDVAGSINIQNKVDSPAGRGWHIGGAQKILNPDRDRLLLEEASGQTSSYVIDNIISTEYASNTNLVATDLGNDTHMLLVQNTTELVSYSFNDKQTSTIASIPKFSGRHTWNVAFPPWPGFWICGFGANNFTSSRSVEQLVELPNGEVYATDLRGTIFRVNTDGSVSNIAGGVVRTPWNWGYWGGRNGAFCRTPGVQCGGDIGQGFIPAISCPWAPHPTSGFVQQAGYAEGTLNGSRFNNPMGLIPGRLPSSLIVADSGNNRVRLVDLVNSQVSTIVGNGQTFDSGDGLQAAEASLYHPRGLLYDSQGNLYISTERGLIRKVDPNGRITTFAGKLESEGGVLADNVHSSEMLLNKPYGMVIDEANQYFYIADSGNNRVMRIDLTNMLAKERFIGKF